MSVHEQKVGSAQEPSVHDEAYKGNFNYVREKIEADPELVSKQDANGRIILHWAALNGNEEFVRYLLDKGSQVNHPDDIGMTPIILAASAGRVQACHTLISKGANVNSQNHEGHSALQYAASKGWIEIVKMLLINHADINISDKRGAKPLHRAASKGQTSVLKVLLDFGNQLVIDSRDIYGCTALHLSCEENRIEESKLLVSRGASLEITNKEGKTPLDLAAVPLARILKAITS